MSLDAVTLERTYYSARDQIAESAFVAAVTVAHTSKKCTGELARIQLLLTCSSYRENTSFFDFVRAATGNPHVFDKAERGPQPLGGHAKRAFDTALAATMLVLVAPIMLIVGALIRVLMSGPAIFAQQRIGFNGKVFVCYKFRTMAVNAEELLERHLATNPEAAREWRETRKLLDDPRVNCLGRVLRKSSLDELPQLFNVLRGDMSLIGPRPIAPDELNRYGSHAHLYCSARPGLTGMWQTSDRNRVSYPACVVRDRYYVRRWSIWLDLVLLLKTIPAVLNCDQTA